MTSRNSDLVRAGQITSIFSKNGSGKRLHGRITKEDIRAAGLRLWNGRLRITTDWVNLYQEPELCFSSGDVLVYLRQPGQSSRGPAFCVHSKVLRERGFDALLARCIERPARHGPNACLLTTCPGCDKHAPVTELYIPAPATNDVAAVFDYHITTRNFFAWLYDQPLAGRALGVSLVNVKDRLDQYRDAHGSVINMKEIIAYAESQKYLDFRECIDHALAALHLAEHLQQEDMWIDAFAHAVGMSHRDINSSLEFTPLNPATQALVLESRLEMDVRLARASITIETFFGDDLSGNHLGLSNAARDHFDRFRSFLHAFYIERYGFWPPAGFSSESSRFSIYTALYSEFRNLYHHLVDPESTANAGDHFGRTGGICTLQNIQNFDVRHGFDTLPRPHPQLPKEPTSDPKTTKLQRRRSWNPIVQKRADREQRTAKRTQALIDASNRDMTIMSCALVRRYSEFEIESVAEDIAELSWIEARKVRWILVYAILQTLISIMAVPKHVRNTEGLSYSLCCHVPTKMPWAPTIVPPQTARSSRREIVPDVDYLQANSSTGNLDSRLSRSTTRKERRQSLPARSNSAKLRSASVPRVGSLKKLLGRKRNIMLPEEPPLPPVPGPAFCEILVHGYGNGLNEVESPTSSSMTFPTSEQMSRRNSQVTPAASDGGVPPKRDEEPRMPHDGDEDVPALSPTTSASVSRESSNASSSSAKSKTTDPESEIPTPVDTTNMTQLMELIKATAITQEPENSRIYNEVEGLPGSIHINTATWDAMLSHW